MATGNCLLFLNYAKKPPILQLFQAFPYSVSSHNMTEFQGTIEVDKTELNLDLTLLGGQSFRISTMIQWLCSNYGNKIGHFNSKDEYTFPSLDSLVKHQDELESRLRSAKFGYRAKFIAQSVQKINEFGGLKWFDKLRSLSYDEARNELVQLPGIGFKVADCICLMSLNHLESVPIDTHIFKITQNVYMPNLRGVKAVTPKIYEDIAGTFRNIYGEYAGWAQAVLFCSELRQFQTDSHKQESLQGPKKKRSK
ncbi:8-oxoguanine DNA glycosylase [Haematobia irritans]|uniref:8-oxoguanine DNA glycosylase n=1 Tax=Haematobia irritans TaxID=7368 RepID=UPI003F4FF82B